MPVEIIAEIGQAHEGSLGMAHAFIDALAEAGVDTVKFQVHIAEAESSVFEPFRVPFSVEDASRYDYWKRMEFEEEQWIALKNHCTQKGINFLASPFSMTAIDLLERIGAERYKIGSGEVTNGLLLSRLSHIGKPVIMSNGLADDAEIQAAIDVLKPKVELLTILQCTTAYPSAPSIWHLDQIPKLLEKYQMPVGYSDHSARIAPSIAAVALGATVIECHATFDRKMFGPDSKASLTIDEIKLLTDEIKSLDLSLNSTVSRIETSENKEQLRTIFGKSLCINKALPKGHCVQFEDLESKKPGGKGIPANSWQTVVGRPLGRDMAQWSFLQEADFLP